MIFGLSWGESRWSLSETTVLFPPHLVVQLVDEDWLVYCLFTRCESTYLDIPHPMLSIQQELHSCAMTQQGCNRIC